MGLWKDIKAACYTPKPNKKPEKEASKQQQQQQQQPLENNAARTSNASQNGEYRSSVGQPTGVTVDFETNGGYQPKQITAEQPRYPSQTLSVQSSQEGFLGSNGVYVPHTGFRTPALLQEMQNKYDIPVSEIKKAMEFAESAEYVDVYCFTYCITGGPMEPTAYKVAGLQGMEKDAILESLVAPGTEIRALSPEEQARHDRAKRDYLVERALNKDDEHETPPEDLIELTEAYRIRFEEDTSSMTLDEVMVYFGVPEAKTVAIHKTLHPSKGAATASLDDQARRKAAHAVALDRFNELS